MAEALPWIQAGLGLKGIWDGFNQPKKPATLGYGQALSRAGDVINPMYDVKAKNTLESLDKNLVSRGFYGQRPGDQMVMNTMGDLESNRAAQIAAMANDLVGRSEANALSEWGLMSDLNQRKQGSWLSGLNVLQNAEMLPSLKKLFGGTQSPSLTESVPSLVGDKPLQLDATRLMPQTNNQGRTLINKNWVNPY